MQKIKYICDVQPTHFVVASIIADSAVVFMDTTASHFSFAVFGIEPKDFIEALEDNSTLKGTTMTRNFYSQPSYFVGEDRFAITVAESGDFPGESVIVLTKDKLDKEYFGNIRLDMPIEFMRLLAKTILKVCDEVEAGKVLK